MNSSSGYKIKIQELAYIIFRNIFQLTIGIIFAVVVLLFVFGQVRAGLFLGIISVANIIFGLIQDIHAWLALENLQLLTAPRVSRLNPDGSVESVLTEQIKRDDLIALKTGDQIPCDSIVSESLGLEINEGLITGESTSVPKFTNDRLLAGSIVTAGAGQVRTETVFHDSRIARMTKGIKKHSLNQSPIQQSVNTVIKYAGYALGLGIIFVIARGLMVKEPIVRIILNIGSLASMLVPQGLVFIVTVFFTYGAANLFRKHVLLQEVNATEKLGRIKNLCMDKTGTLTENTLTVESMLTPQNSNETEAKNLAASYIYGSGDSSETISAVKIFLRDIRGETVMETVPFSSWRQFGAVRVTIQGSETIILAGSPDAFLPHIQDEKEKQWLMNLISLHSRGGKRTLCLMRSAAKELPKNLDKTELRVSAVFVFHNNIREGISETVNFFQNRGVAIKIISGDNPHTVSAVAGAAGINHTEKIITGAEMASWSQDDFDKKAAAYTIFARIVPEQKEKIIKAFKKDGFTAMIGDGANDALAIKEADLGIAMFDGAAATRQLAAIVLVNNSFAALPKGVELADDIIRNIEIFSSMFFNQILVSFFLFVLVSLFGWEYPLTPFNITLINYFTISIPGLLISYWTIYPEEKIRPTGLQPFLERVMPFAAWSAVIAAIGVALVFAISPTALKTLPPNTLVLLAFVAFGFAFFTCAPRIYQGAISRVKKLQLVGVGIIEVLFLILLFHWPAAQLFFNAPSLRLPTAKIFDVGIIIALFCFGQYALTRYFLPKARI